MNIDAFNKIHSIVVGKQRVDQVYEFMYYLCNVITQTFSVS